MAGKRRRHEKITIDASAIMEYALPFVARTE
jgi:hypothetical protein